jgi:hypothetical protein
MRPVEWFAVWCSGPFFQTVDRIEITDVKLLAADTAQHLAFVGFPGAPLFQGAFAIRAHQILFISFVLGFVCHGLSLLLEKIAIKRYRGVQFWQRSRTGKPFQMEAYDRYSED